MSQTNEGRISMQAMIGLRLKEVRETLLDEYFTQEDVAFNARLWGLKWTRATVAAIETGRRAVSLEELILLSMALQRSPVFLLGPPPNGERVKLAPDTTTEWEEIPLLFHHGLRLREDIVEKWDSPRARMMREELEQDAKASEEVRHELGEALDWWKHYAYVWPGADRFTKALDVWRASRGDAEIKAGDRYGLDPFAVSMASFATWGRSLTEERDERVKGRDPEGRSLKGVRIAVTRELIEELGPALERIRKREERRQR